MNTNERDPYEQMSDEAFERAEKAMADIDEKFDHLDINSSTPQSNKSRIDRDDAYFPQSQEEKNWVVGVHAAALLGYVFPLAWVIGPLVIWLAKKDESNAVDIHGRDVLNFQISILIYMAIAGILSFILIGIPALVILGLVQLIFSIIGTIKASQGERVKYPWAMQLL